MRPLLICDCDEVLMHMVRHFRRWVGERHGLEFAMAGGDFSRALTRNGAALEADEMWALIDDFFPDEMHRQTEAAHAAEAIRAVAAQADVVILTNLGDHCRVPRRAQLAAIGIDHRVETNAGPKGEPVARLVAEYAPSVAVFVDDLGIHHQSVAAAAPGVWRLQMVAEAELAPHVPPAPAAHARIDDWRTAQGWILGRFAAGRPADA